MHVSFGIDVVVATDTDLRQVMIYLHVDEYLGSDLVITCSLSMLGISGS